ncbi:YbaL family putative K(+) efflux transporter [Ideonella sp.]|uniref:YbaL family putative K(+) efflux transporter n=1 Tax=Ideonella sp. TaxID=1929293 RepID=UPI002B473933|nr:YbaL family putative K(+) efflux transporter [Ideonella sp.]HJV71491.1 YbaL family putative K(+) efflux transporter [Ideonella sp.]
MEHSFPLITTIAAAFGLALVFGFMAAKAGLPALVGYLVAGVLIGPGTPGFVADVEIAGQLAEIGVMLLMFGVGLHFSLQDLMSVRKVALPGAVVQMMVATAMGSAAALWWGWSPAAAVVFGLALSVASTVVLLKALERVGLLESMNGRIAVGWLVVEDLAMVLVLVLLPPLAGALGAGESGAGATELGMALARTLLEVGVFIGLMLLIGRRAFPWLLWQVTRTGSRELFTLCVVAAAVTVAYGAAELFGVSFALGAFFAGMMLRESQFSHRAAEQTLPLRDAFAVLFFVSVGMLFEPRVLIEQPLKVLTVVAIVVFGKSLAAAGLVLLLRYPLNTALTVSCSLAQIGEFSFILAGLGMSLGVLPAEGQSLILAAALISIALNPLVFAGSGPLLRWLRERSELARRLEQRDDPLAELPVSTEEKFLKNQVVIVGHGWVGREIARSLKASGIPFVVADENRELVEQLRREGQAAVSGNATDPATLVQAHVATARMLVIATPQTLEVRQIVEAARALNPAIEVVVRSHHPDDAALLERDNTGKVFVGERELARAMAAHVLSRVAPDQTAAAASA